MKKIYLLGFLLPYFTILNAQNIYLNSSYTVCAADTSVYYFVANTVVKMNDTAYAVNIARTNTTNFFIKMTFKDPIGKTKHGACIFYENYETNGKRNRSEVGHYWNNQQSGQWRYYKKGEVYCSYEYKNGKCEGNVYQYFADGTKNKVAFYKKDSCEGKYYFLYDDGKTIQNNGAYSKGKPDGAWQSFYENGLLAAEETFLKGKLLTYKLYDERGKKTENTAYQPEIEPEFVGGKAALTFFLSRIGLSYPEAAKRAGIEGVVVVSFIVEKDGHVTTVKVISTPDPLLSDAAIGAVESMKPWVPGRQHNVPVPVEYILAIPFKL